MDKEDAKKYLSQVENYNLLINAKINQLRELDEFKNLIGCKNLDSVHSSNIGFTSDKTSDNAMKKVILIEDIQNDIYNYTLLKNNVINDIAKMDNNIYKKVLMLRYVEMLTLEEIAVKLKYNYDYVRQIHNKALNKIKEFI